MKKILNPPDYVFLGLIGALVLFGLIALASNARADSLIDRVKGRILLQVQEHGEAWYVNPVDNKRYYLGRPADAFRIMRDLGIGISNQNIAKIPIAEDNLSGFDRDNDGLSDIIENAIGTDINVQDSDGDGYSDKADLSNGYNPMSQSGLKVIDLAFANSQKGKIFLQVERHGESWYINPVDGKRYFLGRPADAFNIMRRLGLGISNAHLNRITVQTPETFFADKLSSCTKYKTTFKHLLTGETLEKEVLGIVNGKCNYVEQMPNGAKMECKYTESERMTVAQYYKDVASAESFGTSININLGSGEHQTKYTMDGKEVENPLQEAMDNGACVIQL